MESGGEADCRRILREKSKREGCCNVVVAREQSMENTDATDLQDEPGLWTQT